jgi:hypothetical protein
MKDLFLFLAGTCAGTLIFSVTCLLREVYGTRKEDRFQYRGGLKCKLCGGLGADCHDEDLGPVCASCEIELSRVGATLMKLSDKI